MVHLKSSSIASVLVGAAALSVSASAAALPTAHNAAPFTSAPTGSGLPLVDISIPDSAIHAVVQRRAQKSGDPTPNSKNGHGSNGKSTNGKVGAGAKTDIKAFKEEKGKYTPGDKGKGKEKDEEKKEGKGMWRGRFGRRGPWRSEPEGDLINLDLGGEAHRRPTGDLIGITARHSHEGEHDHDHDHDHNGDHDHDHDQDGPGFVGRRSHDHDGSVVTINDGYRHYREDADRNVDIHEHIHGSGTDRVIGRRHSHDHDRVDVVAEGSRHRFVNGKENVHEHIHGVEGFERVVDKRHSHDHVHTGDVVNIVDGEHRWQGEHRHGDVDIHEHEHLGKRRHNNDENVEIVREGRFDGHDHDHDHDHNGSHDHDHDHSRRHNGNVVVVDHARHRGGVVTEVNNGHRHSDVTVVKKRHYGSDTTIVNGEGRHHDNTVVVNDEGHHRHSDSTTVINKRHSERIRVLGDSQRFHETNEYYPYEYRQSGMPFGRPIYFGEGDGFDRVRVFSGHSYNRPYSYVSGSTHGYNGHRDTSSGYAGGPYKRHEEGHEGLVTVVNDDDRHSGWKHGDEGHENHRGGDIAVVNNEKRHSGDNWRHKNDHQHDYHHGGDVTVVNNEKRRHEDGSRSHDKWHQIECKEGRCGKDGDVTVVNNEKRRHDDEHRHDWEHDGGHKGGDVTIVNNHKRDSTDMGGAPGYIDVTSPVFNSTTAQRIASLVLATNGTDTNTTFVLNASNNIRTQVYLVPLNENGTDTSAGTTGPIEVNLKLPIFVASSASVEPYCATFDPSPDAPAPLTVMPCTNDTAAHESQRFLYDPTTGVIHPDWTPSATSQSLLQSVGDNVDDGSDTDNTMGEDNFTSAITATPTDMSAAAYETGYPYYTESDSMTPTGLATASMSSTPSATPWPWARRAAATASTTSSPPALITAGPQTPTNSTTLSSSASNVTLIFTPANPAVANGQAYFDPTTDPNTASSPSPSPATDSAESMPPMPNPSSGVAGMKRQWSGEEPEYESPEDEYEDAFGRHTAPAYYGQPAHEGVAAPTGSSSFGSSSRTGGKYPIVEEKQPLAGQMGPKGQMGQMDEDEPEVPASSYVGSQDSAQAPMSAPYPYTAPYERR